MKPFKKFDENTKIEIIPYVPDTSLNKPFNVIDKKDYKPFDVIDKKDYKPFQTECLGNDCPLCKHQKSTRMISIYDPIIGNQVLIKEK